MSDYIKDHYNPNREAMRQNAQNDYNSAAGAYQAATDQYLSDMNAVYEQAARDLKRAADQQKKQLPQDYQYAYDKNAIQQAVNERQVADRMARMGLADSGLNRTQQTAINLQRSNADQAVAMQKNAQLGALQAALLEQLSQNRQSRLSAENQARYNLAQRNQELYTNLMNNADSKALSVAGTTYNASLKR